MNCYLPIVLVCTRFISHLFSTVLQSFQTFLPGKQFGLTSNMNLPTCDFWPSPLALSSATTEDLSLLEKRLFLSSQRALCWISLLYLSS